MDTHKITYFTDRQEAFVNLLIRCGTRKNAANVLVFLANTPEATSRAIEQGCDLRQPEVSIATKYLIGKGWVSNEEMKGDYQGRPAKIFRLSKSLSEIIKKIEEEKTAEILAKLVLMEKLHSFLH